MARIKLALKAMFDTTMKVQAQGSATALGQDTTAHVGVESYMVDRGKVTFTFGKVTATAAGTSDTDTAYATAQTTATVTNADIGRSITKVSSGSGGGSGSDWASATSTTFFFGIDIKGIELKGGHFTTKMLPEKTVKAPPAIKAGNDATLSIDAKSVGDDTIVKVEAAALATDDFSDAAASVVSSADSQSDHNLFG